MTESSLEQGNFSSMSGNKGGKSIREGLDVGGSGDRDVGAERGLGGHADVGKPDL